MIFRHRRHRIGITPKIQLGARVDQLLCALLNQNQNAIIMTTRSPPGDGLIGSHCFAETFVHILMKVSVELTTSLIVGALGNKNAPSN